MIHKIKEGEPSKPGINFFACRGGFVIRLKAGKHHGRFRYRPRMKPHFMCEYHHYKDYEDMETPSVVIPEALPTTVKTKGKNMGPYWAKVLGVFWQVEDDR